MEGRKATIARKTLFLKKLRECGGMTTAAADSTGIAHSTFRSWYATDDDFAAQVNEMRERATDFVESKLMQKIADGDTTAMIFYLKTQGRNRGWSEKTNLLHDRTHRPAGDELPRIGAEQVQAKARWLENLLREAGRYSEMYTAQITLTASLLVQADEMAATLSTQQIVLEQTSREGDTRAVINPLQKAYLDTAERAQKGLRALGMNIESRVDPVGDDPLADLIAKVNSGGSGNSSGSYIDSYPDDSSRGTDDTGTDE